MQEVAALRHRYAAYSDEYLMDMMKRAEDLTEHAQIALRQEVAERGLHAPKLLDQNALARKADKERAIQTESSKALLRGPSAWCLKVGALTCGAALAKAAAILLGFWGAIWVALAVLAGGYLGFVLGTDAALRICRQSAVSLHAKRVQMWALNTVLFFLTGGAASFSRFVG